MRNPIIDTVKTEIGDYTFKTREEAEAFAMAVALRKKQKAAPGERPGDAGDGKLHSFGQRARWSGGGPVP